MQAGSSASRPSGLRPAILHLGRTTRRAPATREVRCAVLRAITKTDPSDRVIISSACAIVNTRLRGSIPADVRSCASVPRSLSVSLGLPPRRGDRRSTWGRMCLTPEVSSPAGIRRASRRRLLRSGSAVNHQFMSCVGHVPTGPTQSHFGIAQGREGRSSGSVAGLRWPPLDGFVKLGTGIGRTTPVSGVGARTGRGSCSTASVASHSFATVDRAPMLPSNSNRRGRYRPLRPMSMPMPCIRPAKKCLFAVMSGNAFSMPAAGPLKSGCLPSSLARRPRRHGHQQRRLASTA